MSIIKETFFEFQQYGHFNDKSINMQRAEVAMGSCYKHSSNIHRSSFSNFKFFKIKTAALSLLQNGNMPQVVLVSIKMLSSKL
jgi:hypothetical protein